MQLCHCITCFTFFRKFQFKEEEKQTKNIQEINKRHQDLSSAEQIKNLKLSVTERIATLLNSLIQF